MIDARRVDFVALPVSDLGRADAFYGETLGLWRNPHTSGEKWVEYETGNLTLGLSMYGGSIAFGVDDVEARRTKLEEAGVEFSGESFDSGVCHGAGFTDPFGNPLQLHHRYAPLERWELPAGEFERTDFIGVPVTDRPQGVEFYSGTLGLKRNERSSDEWPEFEPGNATILLNTPEQTGVEFKPGNYSIALRVADVAATMERLQGAGVRIRVPPGLRLERLPHGVLRGPGRQLADPPPPLRAVFGRLDAVMDVQRVDFVSFLTQDIPRAKRFYSETLGLEIETEGESDMEFRCGQVTLDIFDPSSIGQPFAVSLPGWRCASPTWTLRVPSSRPRESSSTARRSSRAYASRRGSRIPTGTRSCSTGGSTS